MLLTARLFVFVFSVTCLLACDQGPKALTPTDGVSNPNLENQSSDSGVTEISVMEVLQAEKYTYLNVESEGERYWVAVSKMHASIGDRFFYTGGLLKKDFYSREFDRNFETLYLVSRISPAPGNSQAAGPDVQNEQVERLKIEKPEGSLTLETLYSDKSSYEGRSIKVTGQAVKVNYRIMDRNWIHIEDGTSNNGKILDLTVTTQEMIPLGAVVTLEGTISINKDFGAGYRYEIIMENAKIVP